jgi:hypothetical protein
VATVEEDRVDTPASRSGPSWHSERRVLLVVLAVFALSRVVYYAMGIRFLAADELTGLPQVLAPDLLKHHYFQSIWYLHGQPPLFNTMIGAVLNWSPFPAGFSFQLIFLATGVALALGCYDLGRQLRLAPVPAAVVALVIACSPPVVRWENVLNYDYIVAAFLVWIAAATGRWVRNGNTGALAAIAALAAATVLLRSFMHPLVFVALLAIALLLRRPRAWNGKVIAGLAIPLVLVGGAMLKNQLIFGSPDLSTWLGYNAQRVFVNPLPASVKAQLRADGTLKAPDFPPDCTVKHPNVPALADKFKPGITPPTLNDNWECTITWRNDLTSESLAAGRKEPRRTLEAFIGSAETWAAPTTLYWEGAPNEKHFHGLDDLYRRAIELDIHWSPPVDPKLPAFAAVYIQPDGNDHLSITAVVTSLLAIVGGFRVLFTWRRKRSPARAALLMGSFLVGLATAIDFVLGHDESNRLRFMVEPLTLVVAAGVVGAFIRWWRARDRAPSPEPAPAETATV